MAGLSSDREPVKVVIINTRYVETDQLSFKSVVQSLTGKDSGVACTVEKPFVGQRKRKCGGGSGAGAGAGLRLCKEASFKDLERSLLELPPMEDLPSLWTE
ncbi:unnamed protein product [Ilex paraguariensis]|uniref:VQ domain-containing protein n=1 Tax=Ilex paraguariensis TaxID=185542 RepID=A0ABC8TFP6_9AQUA